MKFSMKKVAATVGGGATLSLLMTQAAMAQQISDIPAITVKPTGTIGDYIYSGINLFLWIIGIMAVVYLIYGGLLYITAGGDAEKANKGRTAITNAIIGIIIVVLALVIYNTAIAIPGNTSL